MDTPFEKLKILAGFYPNDIRLYYQNEEGKRKLMKYIGRIPSRFDRYLLDFLILTNGASILDYCFMGFKNNKLAYSIDEYTLLFWQENNQFALKAIPFMKTSLNQHFCYWIENDKTDIHIIVYISPTGKVLPIATNFLKFITTFTEDIETTIISSPNNRLLLYNSQEGWPENINHWLNNDPDLERISL